MPKSTKKQPTVLISDEEFAFLKVADAKIKRLEKEIEGLKGDVMAARAANRELRDEAAHKRGLVEGLQRVLLDQEGRRELESYHYQRGLIAGLEKDRGEKA